MTAAGGDGRSVLLLNPPSPPRTTANREGAAGLGVVTPGRRGFLYPPHRLAEIGALLGTERTVTGLDAPALGISERRTLALLRTARPAVVVALTSHGTAETDLRFLLRLRTELPGTEIVATAPDPGGRVAALFRSASGPDLLPEIGDVAARAGAPSPGHGARSRPAFQLFPVRRYGGLSIWASRGCPDACCYCPYRVALGAAFVPRPPGEVVEEALALWRDFSPRRLIFRDPVFARDRERTLALAGLLGARAWGAGSLPRFEAESRPEHFDPVVVRSLVRAGCAELKVGVETLDLERLVRVGRVGSPAEAIEYRHAVARLIGTARREGVALRLFVLQGLSGGDAAEARTTADALRAMGARLVVARPFHAYPGTRPDGP